MKISFFSLHFSLNDKTQIEKNDYLFELIPKKIILSSMKHLLFILRKLFPTPPLFERIALLKPKI